MDGWAAADALNSQGLAGGHKFRAVQFEPTASKWAGQVCGGVQLHVLDRYTWRPVTAGLHQVAIIRSIYPDDFAWRLPHFDRLMGTDRVRGQLEAGRR